MPTVLFTELYEFTSNLVFNRLDVVRAVTL